MRNIRIAAVGCGGRGRGHMAAFSGLEDVALVAVCDLDEGLRNAAGEQFGVAAYGNVDEMLDAEAPDGVIVAVPAHLNGKVALPILERGFDTLVEKPPGMSVAETVSLRDAASAPEPRPWSAGRGASTPSSSRSAR